MIEFYEVRRSIEGDARLISVGHKEHVFAGGESHIDLAPLTSSTQIAFVRGGSNDSIFSLAMWADAIRRVSRGVTLIACIPYLPGARADRGAPLGAKVYADFINSIGLDCVVTLDPHSDVAPALYNNLKIVSLDSLDCWGNLMGNDYTGVIAPDLGARKRAEAVAEVLGVRVYQATKKRNFDTREITAICAPSDLPEEPSLMLVVDDICDGGRTFIELAKALPKNVTPDLWVTHGIFSYGALGKLHDVYRYVYTTNSHQGSGDSYTFFVTIQMVAATGLVF